MNVQNSTSSDLDFIMNLYARAIEYQKAKGYNLWPFFDRKFIETEILEQRHWKFVENNSIACILSVQYNDPVIWKEKNNDDAIYLHRITINPLFKGKNLIDKVKAWGIQHAREKNKKYLRMDTWGHNENLRNYYIKHGFNYIGQQYLTKPDGEPEHYGGSVLSLFENEV